MDVADDLNARSYVRVFACMPDELAPLRKATLCREHGIEHFVVELNPDRTPTPRQVRKLVRIPKNRTWVARPSSAVNIVVMTKWWASDIIRN